MKVSRSSPLPLGPGLALGLAALMALTAVGCRSESEAIADSMPRDAIEQQLIGTWEMITPPGQAGSFAAAQRFVFNRNNVFVIPTYKGYGGKFKILDKDAIQLHHDPSNTTMTWRFSLEGDQLIFFEGAQPIYYRRVVAPGSTPWPTS